MIHNLLDRIERGTTLHVIERGQNNSTDACNGARLIERCEEWSEARLVLFEPEQPDSGKALVQDGVSVAMATPFTSRRIIHALERTRLLTIGGDVLHPTLALELLESYPELDLYATYGLSEAGPRVATCRVTMPLLRDAGAVPLGEPLEGVTLRLRDVEPHCGVGELVIRSPTLMLCPRR